MKLSSPSSSLLSIIVRRPGTVLVVLGVLSILSLVPAARLQIVTDLAALLPEGEPASEDYRAYLREFGGIEKILIAVTTDTGAAPEDLAEAARTLAAALAESPLVTQVRGDVDPEDEDFFLDSIVGWSLLHLDLEDAAVESRLRASLEDEAIGDQVALMRQRLLGPSGNFFSETFARDPLGLSIGLVGARTAGMSLPVDLSTGAFLSTNRTAALVIVTPSKRGIDPQAGREIQAALESAYQRTRAASPLRLEFFAVGGPLYAAHDEAALRTDLLWTATGSVLVVGTFLLLAFGGVEVLVTGLFTVGLGLLWTTALVGVGVTRFSGIAIGFTSILFGLGVDYVIHGGTRMLEARHAGAGAPDACLTAFRETGPGIAASALTTAAGFGCLAFAHFRPLREMGLFVAIGILAVLLSTATAGAGLMVLLTRRKKKRRFGPLWGPIGSVVEALTARARRYPGRFLLVLGLLTVVAAVGARALSLDASPQRLRPGNHPVIAAEQRLTADFPVALETSTVTVRAPGLAAALDQAAGVARVLREHLGPEAEVQTPSDWLVGGERLRARMEVLERLDLARAAGRLEQELQRAGFRAAPFEGALTRLRLLATGTVPPLPLAAFRPAWLSESIREGVEDGEGATVAVRLRSRPGETTEARTQWIDAVRQVAPEASFASIARVGDELRTLALGDLTRLGGLALLFVFLVMVVLFRGNLVHSLLTSLPVVLGCTWTFGLWGALGRPIDLFCLASLPVILGLGVDDGLHVLHRARSGQTGSLTAGVRQAGRAMVLTSVTTAAGFGSLGFSTIPALRNGGMLVAVGVLACLLATLLVLPAMDGFARLRKASA